MLHYIYIPGLGDHFDPLRRLALKRWRNRNIRVNLVPMHWSNTAETYEEKYQRIRHVIQEAKGDEIILVGESAGGAMALLAFSRHPQEVSKVFTICGYNHGATDVHRIHKTQHPAFFEMMPRVDEVVASLSPSQRRSIITIYSTRDYVVTPQHSRIQGVQAIVLKTPGHFIGITSILVRRLPTTSR